MKRTFYNATIKWKGTDGQEKQTLYRNYKKIKYKMNGNQLKVYLYGWDGSVMLDEYANVETISVVKYKK